jgi:hypothetical protein
MPGGQPVVEWLNVEQPRVKNLRAGLLARVADGSLRHNDPVMARRAAHYLGFHRLTGDHVEQVLLYIGREPLRMEPRLRHPFHAVRVQQSGYPGLRRRAALGQRGLGRDLLALLTRVDEERVLRRVEELLRKLQGEEQEMVARLFRDSFGGRRFARAF